MFLKISIYRWPICLYCHFPHSMSSHSTLAATRYLSISCFTCARKCPHIIMPKISWGKYPKIYTCLFFLSVTLSLLHTLSHTHTHTLSPHTHFPIRRVLHREVHLNLLSSFLFPQATLTHSLTLTHTLTLTLTHTHTISCNTPAGKESSFIWPVFPFLCYLHVIEFVDST